MTFDTVIILLKVFTIKNMSTDTKEDTRTASEKEEQIQQMSGQTMAAGSSWQNSSLPEDIGEEKINIPEWLTVEETYEPTKDRDHFIGKSIMKLLGMLAAIRENPAVQGRGAGAVMRLVFTLLCIVLMAASHNMAFTYIILAAFLLRAMLLPADRLSDVFGGAVGTALFSAILLLPSAFMAAPRTMLTVSIKVFVSVGLIGLMRALVPFNQITSALKVFHLPDIVIFIFDITLKYIAVLGSLCLDILVSLRLRSVGKNRDKSHSVGGVLGVTFLKSKEMADEMYAAMTCRGFEGEYRRAQKKLLSTADLPLLLFTGFIMAAYIYLELAV